MYLVTNALSEIKNIIFISFGFYKTINFWGTLGKLTGVCTSWSLVAALIMSHMHFNGLIPFERALEYLQQKHCS